MRSTSTLRNINWTRMKQTLRNIKERRSIYEEFCLLIYIRNHSLNHVLNLKTFFIRIKIYYIYGTIILQYTARINQNIMHEKLELDLLTCFKVQSSLIANSLRDLFLGKSLSLYLNTTLSKSRFISQTVNKAMTSSIVFFPSTSRSIV